MKNGENNTVKMTWDEFKKWQRWDEFPEMYSNPPMTVDVVFYYHEAKYYIISDYEQYHIYDSNWTAIFSNKNFLQLLTTKLSLFCWKSFSEIINELDFDS